VTLTLPPIEAQHLELRVVVELGDPFLEQRRGRNLAHAVITVGEIGRAHDAEFVLERREAAAIDDDRNGCAGTGLFEHVLVRTELRIGEQLDLNATATRLSDASHEALETLVQRVGDGERGIDAQRVVGCNSGKRRDDHERARGHEGPHGNSLHLSPPISALSAPIADRLVW
jgi:hypothetical protein